MPRPRPLPGDALLERTEVRARPPRYHVVMINDDFTPMEFVVHVLETIFRMPSDRAVRVMLQVHHHGQGVCGKYSFDVAESKARDVIDYARRNQHPLLCRVEATSDGEGEERDNDGEGEEKDSYA